MNKPIDVGGPAFPQPQIIAANGCTDFPWNGYGMGGLSVRDYLASQALIGLLASAQSYPSFEEYSTCAYHHADAMLKARKETTP